MEKDALVHPYDNSRKNSILSAIKLIKDDLAEVLRFRFFIYLIILSLTLRLYLIFFLLPKKTSDFGPDEGTYARLAEYVSQSLAVQEFPQYGPYLYNQSKSLIWPSSLLIRLGMEAIDSVRIVSALYGTLVPIVALLCYFAISGNGRPFLAARSRIGKIAGNLLLIILIFIPSNFLWTILGLRESASQFWLLMQIYFFIKLNQSKSKRMQICIFGALTVFSTMFSFTSRIQSALLLTFLMVLFGIYRLATSRVIYILLTSVFSLTFGNVFSHTPSLKYSQEWAVYEIKESKQEIDPSFVKIRVKQSNPQNQIGCSFDNQVLPYADRFYLCKLEKVRTKESNLPPVTLLPNTLNITSFEYQRNVNRVGATSALAPSECSIKHVQILPRLICITSEVPYRLTAFLVRPFIFVDTGSSYMFFAGVENIVWLILITLTLCISVKSVIRREYSFSTIFIAAYLILFLIAASLYEGNLGTAFRHKSTTLSLFFLLISLQTTKINSSLVIKRIRLME